MDNDITGPVLCHLPGKDKEVHHGVISRDNAQYQLHLFSRLEEDEVMQYPTIHAITYDNKKIKLNCVDMETACIYETATLLKEDIFYLEVDSLDNELLKYANEKIER